MRIRPLPLLLAVLAVAGCKSGVSPLADSGIADVASLSNGAFKLQPHFARVTAKDGQANVRVSMAIDSTPALPGFHVQDLPGTLSWAQATVTLYNAAVNGAFNAANNARTITYAAGNSTPGGVASTLVNDLGSGNTNVAVDAAGNLYVNEPTNNQVRKFTAGTFAAGTLFTNQNGASTQGSALDPSGQYLFILGADGHLDRFNAADATGRTTLLLLAGATVLAVGPQGDLRVYSPTDGVVHHYSAVGVEDVAGAFAVANVAGLSVGPDGKVYVDRFNGTRGEIDVYSAQGAPLTAFGSTELTQAGAVTVDARNIVYAADPGTGNVTAYQAPAGTLVPLTQPISGASGLAGLAVDAAGTVYTSETTPGLLERVTQATHYADAVPFPLLRPALNYEVQVFLNDAAGGKLAGSQKQLVNLVSGLNNLALDVKLDGSELTLAAASASTVNLALANTFVAGDTVGIATGVDDSQPGVASLVLTLAGPAYGDGVESCAIGSTSSGFGAFSWDSAALRPSLVDPTGVKLTGFDPSKLHGVLNATTAGAASIGIAAYDGHGQRIGFATVPVQVFGAPAVNLTLQ